MSAAPVTERAEAIRDRYRSVFGAVPAGIEDRLAVTTIAELISDQATPTTIDSETALAPGTPSQDTAGAPELAKNTGKP